MKKIKLMIAAFSLILFVPSTSFALLEVGAYGGYTSMDKIENVDMSGFHYGVITHMTFSLPLLATIGAGGYYQRGTFSDSGYEVTKQTLGLDAFARLEIPVLPLKPYGRISTSAWDRVSGDIKSDTRYFEDYSLGGGLAYMIPFPVLKLMLYTEYLYTVYSIDDGDRSYGHTFNVGVKAGI